MSDLARKMFQMRKSVFYKHNIGDVGTGIVDDSTSLSTEREKDHQIGGNFNSVPHKPDIVIQDEDILHEFTNWNDRFRSKCIEIQPYVGNDQLQAVPYKTLVSQQNELKRSIQLVSYESRSRSSMQVQSDDSMQIVPYISNECMQVVPCRSFEERFPALSFALGIDKNRRECDEFEKVLQLIDEEEEYLRSSRARKKSGLKTGDKPTSDFPKQALWVSFERSQMYKRPYSEDLSNAVDVVPCRLPKRCDNWDYIKVICAAADSSVPSLSRGSSSASLTSDLSRCHRSSRTDRSSHSTLKRSGAGSSVRRISRAESPACMTLYERRTGRFKKLNQNGSRSSSPVRRSPLTLDCSGLSIWRSISPQSLESSPGARLKSSRQVSGLAQQDRLNWIRSALNKPGLDSLGSNSSQSPGFFSSGWPQSPGSPRCRPPQSASAAMIVPWRSDGFGGPRPGPAGSGVGSPGCDSLYSPMSPGMKGEYLEVSRDVDWCAPDSPGSPARAAVIPWGVDGTDKFRRKRSGCNSIFWKSRLRLNCPETNSPARASSSFNWSFDHDDPYVSSACSSPAIITSRCISPVSLSCKSWPLANERWLFPRRRSRISSPASKRRLFATRKSWTNIELKRSFDQNSSLDRSGLRTRKISPSPKDARLSLLRSGFRQNSVRQLVEARRPKNRPTLLLLRAQSMSDLYYMRKQLLDGISQLPLS